LAGKVGKRARKKKLVRSRRNQGGLEDCIKTGLKHSDLGLVKKRFFPVRLRRCDAWDQSNELVAPRVSPGGRDDIQQRQKDRVVRKVAVEDKLRAVRVDAVH